MLPQPRSLIRRLGPVTRAYLYTEMLIVVLLGGCFVAAAQTSSAPEPDYSNVSDILDGNRTLLAINDVAIGALVFKTSDGTKINDSDVYTLPDVTNGLGPEVLVRMFDSANDSLFYITGPGFTFSQFINLVDPLSRQIQTTLPLRDLPRDEFTGASIAAGDFRGDGFDEVVIASKSGVRILGAHNPEDPSEGLDAGPVWKPADYRGTNSNLALAVGDFDGKGNREVALSYGNTDQNRTFLVILRVNPKTLALEYVSQALLVLHAPSFSIGVSLAAGRFGSTLHDQVVASVYAYKKTEPFQRVKLETFDFDSSLNPILKDSYTTPVPAGGEIILKAGRFDPNSPYQQVAMKVNQSAGNVQLGILTFDNTLKIRYPKFTQLPGISCSSGMAVGNYARTEPIPQDPSKMQISFKLQIAISSSNCQGSLGLNIYNVDPPKTPGADFVVDPNQVFGNHMTDPNRTKYYGLAILAGDIQGRSFILGEPSKVVIDDTSQPSVIAAMPPMHVDFIPPAGSGKPDDLNLSAIPDGFRTLYETTSSNEDESSTTNATSFGFGAIEKVGAEFEIGNVEAGFGAKVSTAVTAAQNFKGLAEKEHGSYTASDFSVHLMTNFSDHVWFTSTRFNIYVYPVIGRTVCPADAKPNCPDKDKVPLTIQFSAPDVSSYKHYDGNIIPWYQPPWEPGNVLSYPADYAQLQQMVPTVLDKLSKDSTWETDTSTLVEQSRWSTGTTEGSTTSFEQNYSFEYDLSVAGACCGRLVTARATAELNLSGSSGFSSLNKAVARIGKSIGIGIEKPGTFLTPTNYSYPVTPYIFGQPFPPDMVDKVPLDSDVQTSGILRTAFVADPASNEAGGWWKDAYRSAPDVALNHPARWEVISLGLENPIPPNCRQVGSKETTMDCAYFGPSLPNKPWQSLFHIMRGFFISNALKPGEGPQLTTAIAGDKLTLQARVYNYSFAPMPSGSSVHVRFYVQPLDKDKKPVGNSSLINNEDVVLSPIPPFSDDDGAPLNWVLATTTFDTTPYENSYLVFWVVVWMEDRDGKLVPEIAGHGLKRKPGTLKSLADVPVEDYSNNVGFYNSEFYVFPKETLSTSSLVTGERAAINIGKIQLSATRVLVGQIIDVSAELSAANNNTSGTTAVFYDGDPHAGGNAFGLERSPYIAENDTYTVEAPYYPKTCGTHQLFIVVNQDTPKEILRRASPVIVDCPGALGLSRE